MALGTTNITMTAIRDILTEETLKLSELCLSTNINKWSRNKPVRGTFPQSGDGKYGLDLVNDWGYIRPRGLAFNEGYRMGDFRGYKHNALPPFELILHPDTTQLNNTSLGFTLSVNESDITVEDLVLESYYFGVKITYPNTNVVCYSGLHDLGDRATFIDALTIRVNVTAQGTYNWEAFISPLPTSAGEIPDNLIVLPSHTGYHVNGSCALTLENPYVNTINNVSFNGNINCYISGSYINWMALNREPYTVQVFFYNDHTNTFLGVGYINPGDPDTGLPETTGTVPNISPPTGYGTHETIRIESS